MPKRFTRRKAIQAGTSLLAASTVSSAANDKPPLIIDCHAHIYGEDEKKYPTIAKPYRPPIGTGTVNHLKREMKANGVRHVTAIQTSTFYRWDNRFTIDSAMRNKESMVAVCTLDPDDPKSSTLLETYADRGRVRGMRSIPAKNGLLNDSGVRALWKVADRTGIVINVLASRDKRSEIEAMSREFSKLPIVIDHCLNLKFERDFQATLHDMLALARRPNLHAKLTFIPTGTAEKYPGRDMHAACLKIIDAFGPERCVWGSDFPTELWCPDFTYTDHLNVFTRELGLNDATKRAVLGETAFRLWFKPNG